MDETNLKLIVFVHKTISSGIVDIKRKILKPDKLVFRRSDVLMVSPKKRTKCQKKGPK